MKSTFKLFIAAIALIASTALIQPNAQAQPVWGSWTTNTLLSLTNAQTLTFNTPALYVRKNQGLAIMTSCIATDATAAAVTFTFDVSIDGTNYTTSTPFTYAPVLNTTTAVIGWTNWGPDLLGNTRYIRLRSIANAHTNTISCSNVWYSYWP